MQNEVTIPILRALSQYWLRYSPTHVMLTKIVEQTGVAKVRHDAEQASLAEAIAQVGKVPRG